MNLLISYFYITFTVYSLPLKFEDYSVAGLVSKTTTTTTTTTKKRKRKNKQLKRKLTNIG